MNPYIRERITRKLETLSDERLYQVLDYVEFLEAKYAEKPATPVSVFQRFAEGVEDKLRAGGVAVSTVSETMGLLNKAMGVLNGATQSAMAVGRDVVSAAKSAVDQVGAPPAGSAPAGTAPAGTATSGATAVPPTPPVGGTGHAPAPPSNAPGTPPGPVTPPEAAA